MPEISVVTPVYNALPYIQHCIRSVVAEDSIDWELVISDNCSTDGTRDFLASLRHPRIRVFFQEGNLGIFGNLNFLFQQCLAPVSHILCADDYLLPGGMQKILTTWAECSQDVAYICFNRPTGGRHYVPNLPTLIGPEDSQQYFYLYGNLPGNLSNVSLRTSVPREHGWFDQSFPYVGDYEFWSRVAETRAFLLMSNRVSFVRRHSQVASVYLNKNGEYVEQLVRLLNRLYDHLAAQIDPWRLKLHGTLVYDARQRHAGVMSLLRSGRLNYIRQVESQMSRAKFTFPWALRWLAYFLTLGAHIGQDIGVKLIGSQRRQSLSSRASTAK